jgi:hypothetical protein
MVTRIQKPIRREIEIDGEPYTVVIAADGLRLTRKRFRSGVALSWKALWREHGPRDDAGSQRDTTPQR